jgi:hypothetical protein
LCKRIVEIVFVLEDNFPEGNEKKLD